MLVQIVVAVVAAVVVVADLDADHTAVDCELVVQTCCWPT